MTTKYTFWSGLRLMVLLAVALVAQKAWSAETDLPVVHVLATDPWADEFLQDGASFTVFRSGPTNQPLAVSYRLAGTAINGTDYTLLSGMVTIPACASSAQVSIHPIDDSMIEGNETVAIFLEPQYQWPPPYVVCWPSYALAYIQDNDFPPTNRPPFVSIVNPPDGSVFPGPTDLRLVAHATDFDGRVRTVEFFDGNTSLGIVSNLPPIIRPVPQVDDALELSVEREPALYPDLDVDVVPDPTIIRPGVFTLAWLDVPPGRHKLTAVATDNQGASSRSEAVEITVTEPPSQPVVNVRATDPVATEPGLTRERLDTATFTIGRTGPTDLPLTVYYRFGGDAKNGMDYRELPYSAVIPRGASTVDVLIEPLHDNLVEGPEKVGLVIVPPVCIAIHPPPPDCYEVGKHSAARAVINDNDPANLPPVVEIVRPLDGSVFLASADIAIVASARDFDGRVRTVEFFEGDNSLGIVSNTPSILPANSAPQFAIKWPNVGAGHYILTAEATDDDGAKSQSRPVEIKVVERTLPPVVSIEATDAEAAEVTLNGTLNTATFTLKRTGPTDRALMVFFSVGGTAENGVDYREIGPAVMIPPGASSAPVVVHPVDDRLVEGTESVSVTIEPPLLLSMSVLPIDNYIIGPNGQARAIIRDNDVAGTNQPPKVAIVHPNNGDIFVSPTDIRLCAEARDADGFVRSVEFFEGTNSLGVVPGVTPLIANLPYPPPDQVFCLSWADVKPGNYVLTAKATDNRGESSVSEPVRIKVIEESRQVVVTIEATDPNASEGDWILEPVAMADGKVAFIGPPIIERPNNAVFTVKRDRGTNIPLTVHYSLGGTAANGVDYRRLDGSVVIPAGSRSANIVVDPVDDRLVEGVETVIASLEPMACIAIFPPPPECYLVGEPGKAAAYIRDNDFGNQPPRVEISKPASGEIFSSPADIEVVAKVSDPDGYVTEVEFFAGEKSIGHETRVYIIAPPPGEVHTFSIVWSNAPAGVHVLTAVATDEQGSSSRSELVRVVVETNDVRHPVVNLHVIDDTGSEIPVVPPWLGMPQRIDPAIFAVTRTGPTNSPLPVFYRIGGTATYGADYSLGDVDSDRSLLRHVVIPAGASSANIEAWVIDDFEVEDTETVALTLMPPLWPCFYSEPPCLLPNPPFYTIGPNNHAEAKILDNDLKPAPVVTVVASDPDAAESGPDTGTFTVSRTGDTGEALGVFYSIGGTAEEGVDYLGLSDSGEFFRSITGFHFLEIPAGARSAEIVIKPVDDRLAEGRETVVVQLRPQPWWPVVVGVPASAVVTIADNDRPDNFPPKVAIVKPETGDAFKSPADIHIVAQTADADGWVGRMEFFANGRSIGVEEIVFIVAPPPGQLQRFSMVWSNVPSGRYVLTAQATDDQGAIGESGPVPIEVADSPAPPVVNIFATDAFAREGNPVNTAAFRIRRSGETNAPLTVHFAIGGTASNGVDYLGVPGSVTIPAGRRTAGVVITPIDDRRDEPVETVILRLEEAALYNVGRWNRAGAIIVDNDRPRPGPLCLPDHNFHVRLEGANGLGYRLEISRDLSDWEALEPNVVSDDAIHFVDPEAAELGARFYRVRPVTALELFSEE